MGNRHSASLNAALCPLNLRLAVDAAMWLPHGFVSYIDFGLFVWANTLIADSASSMDFDRFRGPLERFWRRTTPSKTIRKQYATQDPLLDQFLIIFGWLWEPFRVQKAMESANDFRVDFRVKFWTEGMPRGSSEGDIVKLACLMKHVNTAVGVCK